MNREILFRGKRLDGGLWVKGDLRHLSGTDDMVISSYKIFGVDESTISQYTGLKDKHGRIIFEGDILSAHLDDEHPEAETRVVVEWRDFGWALEQYSNGQGYADRVVPEDDGAWTIIGNIWDNPELVE